MNTIQLQANLLQERLLHYRAPGNASAVAVTLPELFVALARDQVHDFPSLRPHQRHPWHAFLVQLAALALHQAQSSQPFAAAAEWEQALLALTPMDPDGAAWCLVSPLDRPAFMQPPVPEGSLAGWKSPITAADELDMLITSKNHDLKSMRMTRSSAEDWCYALISLQTQEGFLGAGNYGVSRMNGGFASRCAIGVKPVGLWGTRWRRDIAALFKARNEVVDLYGLKPAGGLALAWLPPWDGSGSLAFRTLDPWYIEVCRRVRMRSVAGCWVALSTGTKAPRIAAKALCGATGDPWMPVDQASAKALTISSRGFDYKLSAELLFSPKYRKPAAQAVLSTDSSEGLILLAQGVTRGQGKTEGYHERRVPISKRMRQALISRDTDALARRANERIAAIAEVRKMVWSALTVLFSNAAKDEAGKDRDASDSVKDRASRFAHPFESLCDSLFFPELIEEIEASDPDSARQAWLLQLAQRADTTVREAFAAGPRSAQLRYRAQAAALSRLHGAMRSQKSKLPDLAAALKSRQQERSEAHHEPA